MTQTPEISFAGVTVTTTRANLRQGAPNRQAPILRKLEAGTQVTIRGLAVGEAISGNAHWFATPQGAYIWAGACEPVQAAPSAAAAATVAAAAFAGPVSPIVRVIDISHGDGVASFADARASGLIGVIHKATTGASGRDDAYRGRRDKALEAGLLWGAYHWGTAAPVVDQVENFIAWSEVERDDGLLVALDYEPTPDNQMTLAMAREFLERIQDRLGRRAVIYSGDLIKSQLGGSRDAFFGAHRLWLAQYGSHPQVQASWDRYWLWQYTDGQYGPDPKRTPGIPGDAQGRLDCDHFAGSDDDLRAQWS